MNRPLRNITLAVALCLLPFTVFAAPPGQPGGNVPACREGAPGGRHLERLAAILDLSEGQRQQIDALRAAERTANEPYRRQLQENRAALQAMTQADAFDEAAVRHLARAKADAVAELAVNQARTRNQIHTLLTPEQRTLAERLNKGPGQRGPQRHTMRRGQ
jgi:Spy/CpxP family protein refolding chaperone